MNIFKKHAKKFYYLLAVILIFIIMGFAIRPHLGQYLVTQDNLEESDAIVVLMGSIPDRTAAAADVYTEGYADKVMMVHSKMVGYDILVDKGIDIPRNADVSKKIALDLGVPEESISILDGAAQSTQDEAIYIRDYLREKKEIESIILVTSKYHSTRAKQIFTKAFATLDRDVKVISYPSEYDNFNPDKWWQDREDFKRVVLEYLKLTNFHIREQFEI
ncbi:uncharacterized SAM-binding protein YcdF (DUF218 family) [Desulfitispora alkaliphila]|uniref:YdcF family protein n=1 Tax=Desulfitispora alkaliphila TaxID=622674 RepID=UPI003D1937AD